MSLRVVPFAGNVFDSGSPVKGWSCRCRKVANGPVGSCSTKTGSTLDLSRFWISFSAEI